MAEVTNDHQHAELVATRSTRRQMFKVAGAAAAAAAAGGALLGSPIRVKAGTFGTGQCHVIVPTRVLDTRNNIGHAGKLSNSGSSTPALTFAIPFFSTGDVGLLGSLTVLNQTFDGFVTVTDPDFAFPGTSNVYFAAKGKPMASLVCSPVGDGGGAHPFAIDIYVVGKKGVIGTIDVTLDITGYFS